MESAENFNTDLLLKDLGGCGLFQVLLVLLANLPLIPVFFSFSFMSFAIYNPGWRCLDNVTSASANQTLFPNQTVFSHQNSVATQTPFPNQTSESTDSHTSAVYRTDTCLGYDSCRRVEFNPEASTLVTEWGLVCSQSWIPSLIISLKMAGDVTGFFVVGYFGDRFGRKTPYMCATWILLCLHLVSLFSVSWEMFAAMTYLSGLASAFCNLASVLMNELVPPVWRIRVISLPIWTMSFVIFAVFVMLTKDWRILITIVCAVLAVSCIPLFWVPESLRWLIVNGRKTETSAVVDKIARLNKAEKPDEMVLEVLIKKHKNADDTKVSSATVLDLFRKGYRLTTVLIGVAFFAMNLVYFALSFGVSKLPGDVYVNMIIMAITELPANLVSVWLGNCFGRKKTAVLVFVVEAFCLLGVGLVDLYVASEPRTTIIMVLVVLSKILINIGWYALVTGSLELYPTIARCTISSYALQTAQVGSIFAPYLIPAEPDTLHICYLVMGGLTLACGFLLCFIPETKGRTYMDTWEECDGDKHQQRGISIEMNSVI